MFCTHIVLGPLQSVMQEVHSDNNEDSDGEDDNEMDSDADQPALAHLRNHQRRLVNDHN